MLNFLYKLFFGEIKKDQPIINHERDTNPELSSLLKEAIRIPIPIECIQPHEYDAYYTNHWRPSNNMIAHIRNCKRCQSGFIARGSKFNTEENT